MINMEIVKCGEKRELYTINQIGGKGFNLLSLYLASKQSTNYIVPDFFIIPDGSISTIVSTGKGDYANFKDNILVEKHFNKLKKPVAVRSSSPLEDSVEASCAGLFNSELGIKTFEDLKRATFEIDSSQYRHSVRDYFERMGIIPKEGMAIIVQEQIINPFIKGTIQLENDKAVIDYSKMGIGVNSEHDETEYGTLEDMKKYGNSTFQFKPEKNKRNFIGEWDTLYLCNTAIEATKSVGFKPVVQIEFCYTPGTPVHFVQIRKLPKVEPVAVNLNVEIPKDAPYIESRICNGVGGDITMPAYVTLSQSQVGRILIETGQSGLFLPTERFDERSEKFNLESKLAKNRDFDAMARNKRSFDLIGVMNAREAYNQVWAKGNSLFGEYILICDKLDESIVGMDRKTSNKKAIITCLEANVTSHAMTVARDLGIPAMGVEGELMDMNYFYNQIETGDLIRMVSDGKKAVAYLVKRRESDPYKK